MYAPDKLRKVADELIQTRDAAACLVTLRGMYENVASRKNAVGRVRALVVDQDIRHDDYEVTMQRREKELTEECRRTGAHDDLRRLVCLRDFRNLPLKRQAQIKKKIMLEEGSDMCCQKDRPFYLTLPLLPQWVEALHLSAEETQAVMSRQSANLRRLSEHVVVVEDVDRIVHRCRKILRDEHADLLDAAIAVALTTGRRMVEVFLKGNFEVDPYSRYSLFFSGHAKRGLRAISSMTADERRRSPIPTLGRGKSIVRTVEAIRQVCTSCDTPRAVNQQWCRKLNTRVKTLIHPDLGFHDLRTLYVLTTFEVFKPHRYGLNGWIAKVLGHSGVDVSVHYTRMQVFGTERIQRHHGEEFEQGHQEPIQEPPRGSVR